MTELRQRMLDAMVQRGFSPRTQETYVGAIRRMAKHYRRDPAQYTVQEVQEYLLRMVKDEKLSYSSMNQAACATQFLFQVVLGHKREQFHVPFAKVPVRQPELLAREEIARLFACCSHPMRRMLLQTMYAAGLRVSEACVLRVGDIDSHSDRMCIRVAYGKGGQARYACRTAALGGQQLACDACGHSHWQYHSCRNRHCPQCGARARDAWLQGRLAEVLPVPYAHLVFTLPHSLNGLYAVHPRWVIDSIFTCTAQTLSEFAANPKWMGVGNGTPALSLVLHTWTQDLQRHVHLHAVMACGVLGHDGHWHMPTRKPDFLFPVQAMSRVFRGKFMAALSAAHRNGCIERDPQGQEDDWRQRHRQLYKHDWVVYAKTPLGGPAQVLEYLSRYTHRTAIGNERIRAVNQSGVTFTVRADDHGGKRRVRLDGTEFVRRFMLHILPTGIKRIRHYGVLASACKADKLAAARQALQMPAINPPAIESAQAFMTRVARIDVSVCPCCKLGHLHVTAVLQGQARLPAPQAQGPP